MKKEIKQFLFTDDMIIYEKKSEVINKIFLELISDYSNVAGYRLIYKVNHFLVDLNEQSE
jgi:hypothetical protein